MKSRMYVAALAASVTPEERDKVICRAALDEDIEQSMLDTLRYISAVMLRHDETEWLKAERLKLEKA